MNITAYHRPATLDDACRLLRELGPAGWPLAGATSLAFVKGDDPREVVDLAWIGCDTIEADGDRFRIGANTRIADLMAHTAPGWVLDRVARRFVSQPMRSMTTLGGNVARVFPWNDFPVALLALDAELVITGEGERVMDADAYFKGQPARHYQPGDLLTEVRVPALGPGRGFAYHKETVVNMDFSLLTLAAVVTLEKRTISAVRIAAGAGVPIPCRITALEDALRGRPVSTDAVKEAVAAAVDTVKWKGSDGCSDAYIRQLALVHLEDVLLAAWAAAKGGVA